MTLPSKPLGIITIKLNNLINQPLALEIVSRYRDTQLQVGKITHSVQFELKYLLIFLIVETSDHG